MTKLLNGPQTAGRQYRNLSEARYTCRTDANAAVTVRDGTTLLADVHRPDSDGRFPALLAASPYPRQMQDFGAPAASSRPARPTSGWPAAMRTSSPTSAAPAGPAAPSAS